MSWQCVHWEVISKPLHQVKRAPWKIQVRKTDIFYSQAPEHCTPGRGGQLQGQGHGQHQGLSDQTSDRGCPYKEMSSSSSKCQDWVAPTCLIPHSEWDWARLKNYICVWPQYKLYWGIQSDKILKVWITMCGFLISTELCFICSTFPSIYCQKWSGRKPKLVWN